MVPFLIRRGVVWLLWLLWTGPIVSSSSSSTSASATPLSRRRIAEMYYMYGDEDGTLPYNDDYNPPDGGTSAVELRSPVDDFVPLSCNANLPQATCVRWSVYFGTSAVHNVRLVVRCGDCVTMDFGPSLTLNDGLDIHGKLVFPENYAITLYTAGIVVMGELEMQSTRAPITSTPLIRFVMIAEDENRAFVPIGENAAACGRLALAGSSCVVGKKSITVAGGKMNGMCAFLLPSILVQRLTRRVVFHPLCPVSSSPRHTRQCSNVDPIVRRFGWDREQPNATHLARWQWGYRENLGGRSQDCHYVSYDAVDGSAAPNNSVDCVVGGKRDHYPRCRDPSTDDVGRKQRLCGGSGFAVAQHFVRGRYRPRRWRSHVVLLYTLDRSNHRRARDSTVWTAGSFCQKRAKRLSSFSNVHCH